MDCMWELRKVEESWATPRLLTWAAGWMVLLFTDSRCFFVVALVFFWLDKGKVINYILGVLSFRGFWAT